MSRRVDGRICYTRPENIVLDEEPSEEDECMIIEMMIQSVKGMK